MICLNETWLEKDAISEDLLISQYDLHLNSNGRGKGNAVYFKKELFKHDLDIKEDHMQLTKFSSLDLDIIAIYRSQRGNYIDLNENIEILKTDGKPVLITGDLNFCYLNDLNNPTKLYLKSKNFSQLIHEPTHIEGHVLDQAYLKGNLEASADTHCKYYTDHKGLAIILSKGTSYPSK